MLRAISFIRALKLRGWIALSLMVAAVVGLPRVLSSRFVSERRAALSLRRAQAHLASRELDEARDELRVALRLQPGNAEARQQLAALELGTGNRELAFLELESLTELHPENPDGWIGLADLLMKGGLLEAPEAALDKAIAAAPGRADAHLLRADVRFRLGRYYGARLDAQAAEGAGGRVEALLAKLDAALARGPAPVPPRRFRAEAGSGRDKLAALAREHWPGRLAQVRQALEVQMRHQDWTAAQRVVESARRTYRDGAFAPFLAGILELARGDPEEAQRYLSESLEFAPRSPVIATALAKSWSRRKGAAFAGEQLVRLAERDPGFAFARSMAARAFMDARDPIRAEGAVKRGLESQPDSPVPFQSLAGYYLDVDRGADALSTLHRGLDRFPGDLDLQMMAAQVDTDLGDAQDAIRVCDDVLSRRPDLDLVEYKLAGLLASRNDDQRTRVRLMQVMQHLHSDLPSDPLLLDSLGWAHFRLGETNRARALLEAAVDGAPDEPGPRFHLATLHARENRADLARSELKAALDSKRPFPERLEAMRLLRAYSPASTATKAAESNSAGR